MKYKIMFGVLALLLLTAIASAELDLTRELRLQYGHVMRIDKIGTEPNEIVPGGTGIVNIKIRNAGDTEIKDIRVQIIPPSGISFLEDVSKRQIACLLPNASYEFSFNIIASPSIEEGVYSSYVIIDYLNRIGEEREENDTFAMIIKSQPDIFVKVEESEIYKGNGVGDVTITFVNNEIADIKFLTVELLESEYYDIISPNKMYIGDLDSDDFESVDFTMRLLNEKDYVTLPLRITYKDALNNDYTQDINVDLRVRDAKDFGNGGVSSILILIIFVAILIVIWIVYRTIKKRRENNHYKDGVRKR